MKIGEKLGLDNTFTDANLQYLKQLGVDEIAVGADVAPGRPALTPVTSALRRGDYYQTEDLVALKEKISASGLRLFGLSHTPYHRFDKIIRGLAGRDEQIEHWQQTLRNMGRAGIPLLQYNWAIEEGSEFSNWRTSITTPGRGNAMLMSFDYRIARKAPVTDLGRIEEEELWANLIYFMKAVIPVAEESGVRMVVHPADPQVPSLAGIARILRSVEAYDRLFEEVPSENSGIVFCLGCFAQCLGPEGVYDAIKHFGRANKIGLVHFRNVQGTIDNFSEVYPDEGKLDMLRAVRSLAEVGFDGHIIPDHTPHGVDDTDYGHRGKAFAIGYMKGLLQAV